MTSVSFSLTGSVIANTTVTSSAEKDFFHDEDVSDTGYGSFRLPCAPAAGGGSWTLRDFQSWRDHSQFGQGRKLSGDQRGEGKDAAVNPDHDYEQADQTD